MKKNFIVLCCLLSTLCIVAQEPESFKTSDGETLYYTTQGDGPRVFILGFAGWDAGLLSHWVDSLSADFECILPDLRGTGHSSDVKIDSNTINMDRAVEDIEDLRKHLREEKITITGISFGAALTQNYIAKYPENAKNIVLVSPLGPDYNYDIPFTDNVIMRFYPKEKDSIDYWHNYPDKKIGQRNAMKQWLKPYFYDHNVAEQVLPVIFNTYNFNADISFFMFTDIRLHYNVKEQLPNYKGACTILKPRQDPIPTQISYQIKELIPQTVIIFIEKCGHLPGFERPDVFYKLLREAL